MASAGAKAIMHNIRGDRIRTSNRCTRNRQSNLFLRTVIFSTPRPGFESGSEPSESPMFSTTPPGWLAYLPCKETRKEANRFAAITAEGVRTRPATRRAGSEPGFLNSHIQFLCHRPCRFIHDEAIALRRILAEQIDEGFVRLQVRVDLHLQQPAMAGIERRLGEFLRIHFT